MHSNVSLNHEITPVINVTINATDNGSPRYSVQVCVSVTRQPLRRNVRAERVTESQ